MRRVCIPMKETDKEWVREYLSHDAATNREDLQSVDTWLVQGYDTADGEVVEVYEIVKGKSDVEGRDGFPMNGDMESVIRMLTTTGFPISDYQ